MREMPKLKVSAYRPHKLEELIDDHRFIPNKEEEIVLYSISENLGIQKASFLIPTSYEHFFEKNNHVFVGRDGLPTEDLERKNEIDDRREIEQAYELLSEIINPKQKEISERNEAIINERIYEQPLDGNPPTEDNRW